MNEELKPCPFCNSEAFLDGKEGELVSCNNCGARAEINLWNNRPMMEEAQKLAYFEGFRDAFGAMKAMCNEETSSMFWHLRGIRKQK